MKTEQVVKVVKTLQNFYSEYERECEHRKGFISKKKCPRCGEVYLVGDPAMNSTSHFSPQDLNFYICNECSFEDAVEAMSAEAETLDELLECLLKWDISQNSRKGK